MRPGIVKEWGGGACTRPSSRRAMRTLRSEWRSRSRTWPTASAQRQAFVLAHGQLLCSRLSALVDMPAEARCAGLGGVIEVA
jgi:hypothetical protein